MVTGRLRGSSQRSGDGPVGAVSGPAPAPVPPPTFWPVRGTSPPRRRVLRSPRVTMGATLAWPAMAVVGFVVLTCLVVALGTSSTARYEFEHNGTRDRQRAEAPGTRAHPAGSRARRRAAGPARGQARRQAVDVAVRPAPAAATGGPGWWLVDDAGQGLPGPFAPQGDPALAPPSRGHP